MGRGGQSAAEAGRATAANGGEEGEAVAALLGDEETKLRWG